MAQKFVLTAQLELQSPQNVAQVVRHVKSQLKGMDVALNVKTNPRQMAQTSKQLSQVSKEADKASASTQRLGKTLGAAARRFAAFSIATGTFLALARAVQKGTQEAIEFERELIRISQVTGKSVGQLRGLTNEVTRLATSLGASSSELLNAARTLSQAGFSAERAQKALRILAQTDLAATFNNIADTTEGAIALLRQFRKEANAAGGEIKFLEQSLDAINAVSKKFAVESGDLITVIRRTGGVFEAAGGKLNELIALFTSVRATTRESAETIAVGFRTIFTRIQRSETIDQLKELGIALQDAKGQFVGPLEAINRLARGLSSLDPRDYRFNEIVESLGGFRQIGKVIPLIKQFSTAQEALNVAQGASGSTARDALTAQKALGVQIGKIKQDFSALMRDFVDSSSFRTMTKAILGLAGGFIKMADSLKPLMPMLLSLAALKIGRGIAPALAGFTGMRKFARGGLVPGSGNRDTVPAMLTPGEFVIKKSSVRKMGAGQLRMMNENRHNRGGIQLTAAELGKTAGMKKRMLTPSGISPKRSMQIGGAFLRDTKDSPVQRRLTTKLTPSDFKGRGGKGPSMRGFQEGRKQKLEGILGGGSLTIEVMSGKIPSKVAKNFEGQLRKVVAGPAKRIISNYTGTGFSKQGFENALNLANFEQVSGNLFEAAIAGSNPPFDNKRIKANAPFDYPSGLGNIGRKLGIPGGIPTDAKRTFGSDALASLVKKARNIVIERMDRFGRKRALKDAATEGQPRRSLEDVKGIFGGGNLTEASANAEQRGYSVTGKGGKYKIQKKAAGGSISGSDTVPALLTPGEFVINKASAQRIGYGNLGRMNRKGYAAGGVVAHGRHAYGNGIPSGKAMGIGNMSWAAVDPIKAGMHEIEISLDKLGISGENAVRVLTTAQEAMDKGSTAREAWAAGIQEMTKAIAENEKAVQKANKKGGAGDAAVDDLNKFGGGLGTVAAGTAGAAKGGDAKAAQMLADIQQQEIISITAKIKASDKVRTGTEKGISIAEARMRAEAIVTQRYGVLAKDLKSLDKSSQVLEKAQKKAAHREKRAKQGRVLEMKTGVTGGAVSSGGRVLQEMSFMGTAAALTAVQFMNLSAESEKAATQTVALMGALANGVGTVAQIAGPLVAGFGGLISKISTHMAVKAAETAANLASAGAEGLETAASGASAAMEGVEAGASGAAAAADLIEAGATSAATAAMAPFAVTLLAVGAALAVIAVITTTVVAAFAYMAFKSRALAESQGKLNDEMLKSLGEGKGSIADFVTGIEAEQKHNETAAQKTRHATRAGSLGFIAAGAAAGSLLGPLGTLAGGATAAAIAFFGGEEAVNKWLGASKEEANQRKSQIDSLKRTAQALGELAKASYETRTAFEDIAKDETLDPQQRAEAISDVAKRGRSQMANVGAAQRALLAQGVTGPLGDEQKKETIKRLDLKGPALKQFNLNLKTAEFGLKHFAEIQKQASESVQRLAAVEFTEKTFSQLMKEGGAFAGALRTSEQAIIDNAKVQAAQLPAGKARIEVMRKANEAIRRNRKNLQKQSQAAAVLRKRTAALNLMFAKQRQSMHRALMVLDHFDKFGRVMATLERSFNNLSAVVEGTAMDFKAIPVKGLDDLNKVGNIKQFNKDVDKMTTGMGPAAAKIGDEVKKTAEVLRKGRGIIGQKRGVAGQAGQVVEAGKILKDLGITEADVGPELFGVLKTGLMEALKTGGMIDPDEFDQIFAPLVKASKNNVEALKKLQDIQNGFLEKYSRAINDLLDMMGRENEARAGMVDVRRRGAERMAEARGGSLTPAAAESFRVRRAQESLRGVRDARSGGQLQAGDVEGARRTLHHSELQRRRLSARIETADIHQKKKLIQQDALLRNQVARTREELERLADQSDRASDVMGEIAKERAGREAQMGALEKFVVGGKEERQEMAKSFMGLQRALSTGTLQSMPAEFRKLTVGLLNEFKDVRIPGAGGLTGQQVKQQLVLSDAVKMGLVSPQMAQGLATGMPEEQRLLHELGSINQEELRAQEAIKESASETVKWAAAIAANTDAMYRHLVKSMGGATGAAPRVGAGVLRTRGASSVGGFASGGQVVYRADGGSIFQPRGTDTVPAMLTPGEFVIRKSAVDRIGTGALHSINNGAAGTVYRARGGPVPGAGRDFTGVEGAVNIKGGGAARTMMAQMLRGMSARKFKSYALHAGFTKSMVQQTMRVISDGNYDFTNNVASRVVADTANWLGQWKHLFSVADSRRVGFHKDAGDGVGKLIKGLASHSMFSREVGGSAKYRKASFKLAGLVAPQYISQIKAIREAAGVFFAKKDVIRRRREGKYVSDSLWSAAGLNRVRGIDQVKGQGDRAARRAAQGMGGGWKRVPARDKSGKVVRKKGKVQYRVVPNFGQSTQQLFGVDQEDMGFDWGDKREKRRVAPAFASGGSVDSVPAMLTPGEFVMSRGAVQKHGVGFMQQLNQGRVQGFNKGGIVRGGWPAKQRLDPSGEPGLYKHWEGLPYEKYKEKVERARKVAGLQARGYHTHVSKTGKVTPQFDDPLGPAATRGTIGQNIVPMSALFLQPTRIEQTRRFKKAALKEPIPQAERRKRMADQEAELRKKRIKEHKELQKEKSLRPIIGTDLADEWDNARYWDWDILPKWAGVEASKDLYRMHWLQRKSRLEKESKSLRGYLASSPVRDGMGGKNDPMPNSFLPFNPQSERLETWYGSSEAKRNKAKWLKSAPSEIAFMDKLLRGTSAEEQQAADEAKAKEQAGKLALQAVYASASAAAQLIQEGKAAQAQAVQEAQKIAEDKQAQQKRELDDINRSAKIWLNFVRNTPHTPADIGGMFKSVPGTSEQYKTSGSKKRQAMVATGQALPFSPEEMLNQQGLKKLGELYKSIEKSQFTDWAVDGTPIISADEKKAWGKSLRAARESSTRRRLEVIENKKGVLDEQARKRGYQRKNASLPGSAARTVGGFQDASAIRGAQTPEDRERLKEQDRQKQEAQREADEKKRAEARRRGERIENLRRRRYYAQGGPVYLQSGGMFQPRGTDTVPAMLTPGEFVIRKSAVDKIGVGNLTALNNAPGTVYRQQGGIADRGSRPAPFLPRRPDYLIHQENLDYADGFSRYTKLTQEKHLWAEQREEMRLEEEAKWYEMMGPDPPWDAFGHPNKEQLELRRDFDNAMQQNKNVPSRMPSGHIDWRGNWKHGPEPKGVRGVRTLHRPRGFNRGGMVNYLQSGGDPMEKARNIEEERWFRFQEHVAHEQRSGRFGNKFNRFEGSTDATMKRILAYEKKEREAEKLERFGPNPAMKALQWATTNKKTGKLRQGMRPFQMIGGLGTMYSQTIRAVAAGFHDPEEAARRWISANQGMMETLTFGQASRSDLVGFQGGRNEQQQYEDLQDRLTDPQGLGRKDPIREASKWLDFGLGFSAEAAADFGTMKLWRLFKQARATTTAAGAASKATSTASKAASFTPEQQVFMKKMEEFIKANPSVVGAHPSTLPSELAEMMRYNNLLRQGRAAEYAMTPEIAKQLLNEIPMQQALPAPAKTSALQMVEELGSGATKTDMHDIMRAMMGGELPYDARIKQLTARHKAATTPAEKAAIQKEMAQLRSQAAPKGSAGAMRLPRDEYIDNLQWELDNLIEKHRATKSGLGELRFADDVAAEAKQIKYLQEEIAAEKLELMFKGPTAGRNFDDKVPSVMGFFRDDIAGIAATGLDSPGRAPMTALSDIIELDVASGHAAQKRAAAYKASRPGQRDAFFAMMDQKPKAGSNLAEMKAWEKKMIAAGYAERSPEGALSIKGIGRDPRWAEPTPTRPATSVGDAVGSGDDLEKFVGTMPHGAKAEKIIKAGNTAEKEWFKIDEWKRKQPKIYATKDEIEHMRKLRKDINKRNKIQGKMSMREWEAAGSPESMMKQISDSGSFGPKSVGAAHRPDLLKEPPYIPGTVHKTGAPPIADLSGHIANKKTYEAARQAWMNNRPRHPGPAPVWAFGKAEKAHKAQRAVYEKQLQEWVKLGDTGYQGSSFEKMEKLRQLTGTHDPKALVKNPGKRPWWMKEGTADTGLPHEPGHSRRPRPIPVEASKSTTWTPEQWTQYRQQLLEKQIRSEEFLNLPIEEQIRRMYPGIDPDTPTRGTTLGMAEGGWVPRTSQTKKRMEQWRNDPANFQIRSNMPITKVLPAGGMRDATDELNWRPSRMYSGLSKDWMNVQQIDHPERYKAIQETLKKRGSTPARPARQLSEKGQQRKQRLEFKAYQKKIMRWRMGLERRPPQPPAWMGAGMWQGPQRGWGGPQNFQHGGNVDSVPAMLTPGEFVMNRQAVQRHGTAFMQSLNKGEIPGFNRGGPVYAATGVNVRNAAGAPGPSGDMAAEFARVGATLSDDLKNIFGTMEFHHRVTVDGQLNIGGINSEVVANAVRDALANYVVGTVKKGLDAARNSFRGTE